MHHNPFVVSPRLHHWFILLGILGVLAGPGTGQVAPVGTLGSYPDLYRDAWGDLHLAYARSGKTYYRLIHTDTGRIDAEEDTRVGASRDHQMQPDVVVDSRGVVHALGNATYNTRTLGVWGTPMSPGVSRDHHMAVDSRDDIWIVYRAAMLAVNRKKAGETTFGPRVSIFNEGTSNHVYPDIAAGSDGTVHVVFRARGAPYMNLYDCGYVWFDGSNWHKSEWPCGHQPGKVEEGPHVALDVNNVPWVSWADGRVRVNGRVNGVWGTPKNIGVGHSRDEPVISVDRAGNRYVAWWGGRFNVYNQAAGKWLSGQLAPTGKDPIGYVDLAAGENETYLVWEEGSTVSKSGAGAVDLVVARLLPDTRVVPFKDETKPTLAINTTEVSAALGANVAFQLTPGSSFSNRPFLLVTGVTGTVPGTPLLENAVLPINLDAVSLLVYFLTFSLPEFSGLQGILDHEGLAKATMKVAPGLLTTLIGARFTFAYMLLPPNHTSNAVSFLVKP